MKRENNRKSLAIFRTTLINKANSPIIIIIRYKICRNLSKKVISLILSNYAIVKISYSLKNQGEMSHHIRTFLHNNFNNI